MTNGISVNDMVQVKTTGEIGRVVAIDDHTDRLPADLQVEFEFLDDAVHTVARWSAKWSNACHSKLRVDEVIRVTEY